MNDSSKTSSQTWRPAPQRPRGSRKSARRLGAALVAVALIAVSGALLAWLLILRPFSRVSFLPLCIGEYSEEFPVRSWVQQDSDALRGLAWKETNAFTTQERPLLLEELRQTVHSTSNRPLVIYLSGYALSNSKEELCILPAEFHLDRPDSWLPLRDLFRILQDSKAPHKLLLLDIMQPFTDARRGLLVNDAAERLQPLLDKVLANDPHLSVLCATAPDQDSLVAEELGHSVFAHFLCEGLRGQADGVNPRRQHDDRVSLLELAEYVKTQVEQWTLRHRKVRQTPQLYGSKDDYPLIWVNAMENARAEAPEQKDYPQWLTTRWKMRDQWFYDETYRLLPQTFQELETALLRAEQRWRGGFPAERVSQELTTRLEQLERQHRQRFPAAKRRAAELWNDTLKAYEGINVDLSALTQAHRCCAEARVLLAGYVPYLEVDAASEPTWEKAVTTTCELRRLLATPPGADREEQFRKIRALTATLRNDPNNLNKLRRPLDRQELDRLIGRSQGGDDADLKMMTALLATPWPSAEQRSRLWSARQELLAVRQNRRAGSSVRAGDGGQANLAQYQRGLLRGRLSVRLLQLEGAEQLQRVENSLAEAIEKPTDTARLRVLGEELKQAWLRQDKIAAGLEGR